MLHCGQYREITSPTHLFEIKQLNLLNLSFIRILFSAICLKDIFVLHYNFFSVKVLKKIQMIRNTNKQMNTYMMTKSETRPLGLKYLLLYDSNSRKKFGSQILWIIHSANMILSWKWVFWSRILRKYRG